MAFLCWPALVLVIWGSLAALKGPILDLGVSFEDLILHFTAYGGLTGMVAIALKDRRHVVLVVITLMLMGGALELVQTFMGREHSMADELANMLGALTGASVVRPIVERLRRRYDSLTQSREGTGS